MLACTAPKAEQCHNRFQKNPSSASSQGSAVALLRLGSSVESDQSRLSHRHSAPQSDSESEAPSLLEDNGDLQIPITLRPLSWLALLPKRSSATQQSLTQRRAHSERPLKLCPDRLARTPASIRTNSAPRPGTESLSARPPTKPTAKPHRCPGQERYQSFVVTWSPF